MRAGCLNHFAILSFSYLLRIRVVSLELGRILWFDLVLWKSGFGIFQKLEGAFCLGGYK